MNTNFLLFWDKVRRSFILAIRSLWLHKLRAMLSVLGIIIGTAAVIALMAFGEGSMRDALEDIERQGAKNIIVRSVKPADDSSSQRRAFILKFGLNYADYERFPQIPSVELSVPMRIFPQEIRRAHRMVNGRVVGTTENYDKVNKIKVAIGRFIHDSDDIQNEADDTAMRNVCVLGSDAAETLFPFEDPLGKAVVINKHHYVVVGVLAERMPTGAAGGSSVSAEEFNNDVYIPLRTCLGRFGEKVYIRQSGSRSGEQVALHQVTLAVRSVNEVRSTGELVRYMLERDPAHVRQDWGVTVPLDRLELAEKARDRYKQLLVLIASISLVVGGIGIMNIMLATVTERTREIGIRRALGAKRKDITLQFLIEAVVQTSLGGLCGVLVGLAIVFGLPPIINTPAQLHVPAIFMSIIVAVGVGVLFGWYPAQRAAGLDPIEALRHE